MSRALHNMRRRESRGRKLSLTFAMLLALVVTTFAMGTITPSFATGEQNGSTNWAGAGAGNPNPGCQTGQTTNFLWELTTAGDNQFVSGLLNVNLADGGTAGMSGEIRNSDPTALYFQMGVSGPAAVQSASATFTYTGTSTSFTLALLSGTCSGTPTPQTYIDLPSPGPKTFDSCNGLPGMNNASWDVPQDTATFHWGASLGDLIVSIKQPNTVFSVNGKNYYDYGQAPDNGYVCPRIDPRGSIKQLRHHKVRFTNNNAASNSAVWFTDKWKLGGRKVVKRYLVAAGSTLKVVMKVPKGARVKIIAQGSQLCNARAR